MDRVSPKSKIKKDSLYKNTEQDKSNQVDISTSKLVNNEISKQNDEDVSQLVNNEPSKQLKRQTYYLDDNMIKALGLKAVMEGRDKSEIVREAIKFYVEQSYFDMANK